MGTENTTSKYVEIKNYTVLAFYYLLPVTFWAKYVNPRGPKKHTKNLGPVERSIIYSFFFWKISSSIYFALELYTMQIMHTLPVLSRPQVRSL